MKISEIYGKAIASVSGKRRGVILGALYENDTVKWLICCDEEEKRFCVAAENLIAPSGDTRFSKAEKALKNAPSLKLGKGVYNAQGNFLGYLEDCILSGFKITYAVVGGKKIPFENLTVGDICLIKEGDRTAELAAKDMFIDAVCSVKEDKAKRRTSPSASKER